VPTYEYRCQNDHVFDVRCSIAARPDVERCQTCDRPATRLISVPHVNNPEHCVLDYPGSKRLKAGYVHSHGDKIGTKVMSGPAGMTRPDRKHEHPIAKNVIPEPVRFRKPSTD
jgi:putative FmdB family regulatory protein